MVICFCANVTEDDILQTMSLGHSFDEALVELQVGEGCRKCLSYLNENRQEFVYHEHE